MGKATLTKRWTAAALGLFVGALIMIAAPGASAEMYSWTDEEGNLHFSDAPPVSGDARRLDIGEESCALKAKLDRTQGGLSRLLLLYLLGGQEAKGEKISPQYKAFLEDYKAEENKCMDGDKEACACIASLARDGATSIAPKGGMVNESP